MRSESGCAAWRADPEQRSDRGVQLLRSARGGAPRRGVPVRRVSSPRRCPGNGSSKGIRGAARGDRVVSTQRSQHSHIDDALRWPGREMGLTERESEILSLLSGRSARIASWKQAPRSQRRTPSRRTCGACTPSSASATVPPPPWPDRASSATTASRASRWPDWPRSGQGAPTEVRPTGD